jgi:hypothetical protein
VTARLDPPDTFDDERRAIWDETIREMTAAGRVFRFPRETLVAYVEAVRSQRQASRILGSTAVLIQRDGRAVENPALAVQRRSATAVAQLGSKLGLDRHPVGLPEPPDASGGARWCDTHHRLECIHHRNARRCECPSRALPPPPEGCCHESVVEGTKSCYHHAGKTLAKARAEGQVNRARLFGVTPADVTAPAALLAEVRRSAALVALYDKLLAELEDEDTGRPGGGLWWGVVRETTLDGGVIAREARAVPHVILAAYNAERDRLVRACAAAINAGAQAAAVDMAKEIAGGLGRLLDAIFGGLLVVPPELAGATAAELVAWQHDRVPDVVPAAIRAWDPAQAG